MNVSPHGEVKEPDETFSESAGSCQSFDSDTYMEPLITPIKPMEEKKVIQRDSTRPPILKSAPFKPMGDDL